MSLLDDLEKGLECPGCYTVLRWKQESDDRVSIWCDWCSLHMHGDLLESALFFRACKVHTKHEYVRLTGKRRIICRLCGRWK